MSSTSCRAAPSVIACQPYSAIKLRLALSIRKKLYVPTPNTKKARPITRNASQRRDSTVRWNHRVNMLGGVADAKDCDHGFWKTPAVRRDRPRVRRSRSGAELSCRDASKDVPIAASY